MSLFEFYRNHIKLALYGSRCEIWGSLECNLDDRTKDSEEDKACVEILKKIDEVISESIKKLSMVVTTSADDSDVSAMDAFRKQIEPIVVDARAHIDALLCNATVLTRLKAIAERKKEEADATNLLIGKADDTAEEK